MTKDLEFRACPEIDRRACRLRQGRDAAGAWRMMSGGWRLYRQPSPLDWPHAGGSIMPKLLYAPASPYSAKVRMAGGLCRHPARRGDRSTPNPTGGAPAGQSARQDPGAGDRRRRARSTTAGRSPSISTGCPATSCSRATRTSAPRPSGWRRWPTASATACWRMSTSGASRPEEMVHQPWLDKQWSKVDACARRAQRQSAEARHARSMRAISRCAPRSAISTCVSRASGKRAAASSRAGRRASTRSFRS